MEGSAKTPNETFRVSPLHFYRLKYCKACKDYEYCNTNRNRRLNCILSAILDTTLRSLQPQQQGGEHH